MTASVAPQEDQVHFPSAWERHVKPTRTAGKPRKVASDADRGRQLLAEGEAGARGVLESMLHDRFKPAGFAFLDGTADPVGAAVAIAVMCHRLGGNPRWSSFLEQKTTASRAMFAGLVADHGLPFAAETAGMFFTLDTGRDPGGQIRLRQMHLNGNGWDHGVPDGLLADLRHRIAATDDYPAVREALARRRENPAERLAATLLAPDEQAWADEVCAEHQRHRPTQQATELLLTQAVTTPEQLDALGQVRVPAYRLEAPALANLAFRLGADAAPIVIDSVKDTHPVAWRRRLHKALAGLPSDEVAAYLVDRLHESDVMVVATGFAQRYPLRILRAVAARFPDASDARRKRLILLLQTDPAVEAALPHLDAAARAVLAPLFDTPDRKPYADPADLPRLLTAPPWTVKRAKRKAVVVEGLVPPPINRVVWAAGEQEAFAATGYGFGDSRDEDAWRKEARRLELRKLPSDEGLHFLAHAPRDIAAPVADRWHARPPFGYWGPDQLKRALARFETTVAFEIARGAGAEAATREAALPIANLPAARAMAEALVRLKSMRANAIAWLDRHAEDAAPLLVPDALGADKTLRKRAETALAILAARHGADAVREAAKQYGEEASAALESLLDADPLDPVGVAIPKAVAWAAPPLLPQVLLAGGERALPPSAIEHLLTVLAIATPEYPYAGVEVVAEACDGPSLARFSLALFEQWLQAGAPTGETWAMTQLAHFADDHTVRVLAPLVAAWPGEHQHQRAVKGLKVLGAIGTETAMRAVQSIARKAKFDAIRWEARVQIDAIAANLSLTADQLADRLVPDFGLGEGAALVLDYGPRRFAVRFDESLKPFVQDGDGKPRKTLPKPGKNDDASIAEDAYRRFAELKKDMRTVAADLVKRLESAMIDGREWTMADFRAYQVAHPLTGQLARRLVWTAEHAGARTAFRVAEDGTFSDVDDETFTPASEATVRLAHPALLASEAVQTWAELLADYEILQPFDQLHRPVLAFTPEELATGRLTRFEGATVETGRILGLTSRGWDRSGPMSGSVESSVSYPLPGGGSITVELDPGIYVGSVSAYPEQTLEGVSLAVPGGTRPEDLDPAVVSEALAGLARLTGGK
ncbi:MULTISPECIES: DUF4132 domain-containing protein [Glycomyces]|uniref:DUF4132 domain-containing protein n=2 Tax=Glycomyces TaxID=58113 RepID=A0A9X3SWT0_9ACTN|nr:DUF4132 domain-containing protein [Glycomyces lechevalierae]MDA1388185.1 DUF4132 domain-containing protein [Glycomyces lechevalierae]MDR7336978.1 hypothetical protein [Glycomyces lechevalierae]